MKRIALALLLAGSLTGCAQLSKIIGLQEPPTMVVTEAGTVVEMTTEERIAHIEAQYQEAVKALEATKDYAHFLPPGFDLAALGALGSLSAYLERRRRQLKREVLEATKPTEGAGE